SFFAGRMSPSCVAESPESALSSLQRGHLPSRARRRIGSPRCAALTGVGSYLVKFDSSGGRIFFKTIGSGDEFGLPSDLAVNARGEVVEVGGDASVLKFNAQGEPMWLQHLG